MGRRDARRLGVVQAALAGKLTNHEGAVALGLGLRQFKRLRRQLREAGPEGVVHGNRGRPSPRRVSAAVRARVIEMLTGEVKLNDHHIADLLAGEDIEISAASVRRTRRELRIPAKRRRRPPRHRRRRERQARRGALVLIDGSPFPWFDAGGPAWTLLGAIDDATSEILALTLRPSEDLHGYTRLLSDLVQQHGVPVALYGDRSGILVRNDAHWTLAEELAGRQRPTHFGHMLEELGVRFIAATSPQAKGRVERLWATLQDRLAAELRLHGHGTLAAALAYLPVFMARHNRRHARPPAETVSAFRPAPRDLDRTLACVYERVIARDNTVRIGERWAQVPPGPHRRSYHKAQVEVRELLDGRLLVLHPRHGVLLEQPSPEIDFCLTPRRAPRTQHTPARIDAPGSRQSHERDRPRVPTPPQAPGIGKLTRRRKPAKNHRWNSPYNPDLCAAAKAAEGGHNH